jgi:glyceraldehyde 3-phosphate dehydrogenase
MTVKVAINGFGRIGRNVLRAIVESGRTDIEVVAINDLGPVETNAHLLRYDSIHGRSRRSVKVEGDTIIVGGGKPIKVTAIKDPATLPHKELGVDIALECTGIFTTRDKAAAHLTAGAKRVIVSAPCRRRRPDRRLRRQPRSADQGPPGHLQRLLHHQLPRARSSRFSTTRSASIMAS